MTPEQGELVERLRARLAEEPTVREVSMFGGRSFMVNEKMIASALKNGGLLVRVAAEEHERLVERAGARQAEMGEGRDMGPGWIEVEADAIADEGGLGEWLEVAMRYNRAVTRSAQP
ncbi:TfoX/Sxy family protein [Salinibacterium sp. dk2585]|uniref:TfoX/Sxy family protein n=1 Tax=unclassified Salinibacterium TaxID=2632331 RepID=UPI0011C2546B|nr:MULTISPECIES: TfoX/Sxy family protein [unclassified Salinibacterium]QEE62011.1 TfoX/Sxy family protein [Salinibacterium sp. dk2585]TXK54434.1 TfoX/Sxy family protein [Salinibacterium sp. dk5596]